MEREGGERITMERKPFAVAVGCQDGATLSHLENRKMPRSTNEASQIRGRRYIVI